MRCNALVAKIDVDTAETSLGKIPGVKTYLTTRLSAIARFLGVHAYALRFKLGFQ